VRQLLTTGSKLFTDTSPDQSPIARRPIIEYVQDDNPLYIAFGCFCLFSIASLFLVFRLLRWVWRRIGF
jgi:hypothetical protein